jgi:hypothetical protein
MFVVFYALVARATDNEMFVDAPFLGGMASNKLAAELLARDLSNDKNMAGVVITKIFMTEDLNSAQRLATRQFNQIAIEIYQMEELQQRKFNKRIKSI